MTPQIAPGHAVRVGARASPRIRPLAEVLAERPAPPTVLAPFPAGGPADPGQEALDRLAATVRPLAARLLLAVADVLERRRPVGHLEGLAAPAVLTRLAGEVGRARPGRTAPAAAHGQRVRGLRVCAVGPGAVEVAAVRSSGARAVALAARLERDGDDARWRLTALDLG